MGVETLQALLMCAVGQKRIQLGEAKYRRHHTEVAAVRRRMENGMEELTHERWRAYTLV